MKALILDDENEICEYIASALEESGVEYEIFLDSTEALRQMNASKYDFGFIDINLPNIDGLEFSKRFKGKFPEADIIFITGYGDYDKAVQAIKIGAYDYIKKPFRRLDITVCVARLLEKKQLYQNQKEMEILKFANDVALELMHQLRNPLAAIGGFSRLISSGSCPEGKLKDYTRMIFEESMRLEKVLKEILVHLTAGGKPDIDDEDAQYLSHSPENEDAVIAPHEVAVGESSIVEKEPEDQDVGKGVKMKKSQKESKTIKKTQAAARKTTAKKSASREAIVTSAGINKEYLKSGNVCKVTFKCPKIAAGDAKSVGIVGDFNNWSIYANPMKKLKSGDYTITLELEPGREYQFRYLIDESRWENDWNADKYVKSPYGDSENSVVIV